MKKAVLSAVLVVAVASSGCTVKMTKDTLGGQDFRGGECHHHITRNPVAWLLVDVPTWVISLPFTLVYDVLTLGGAIGEQSYKKDTLGWGDPECD